jgi:hypothetical protein
LAFFADSALVGYRIVVAPLGEIDLVANGGNGNRSCRHCGPSRRAATLTDRDRHGRSSRDEWVGSKRLDRGVIVRARSQ